MTNSKSTLKYKLELCQDFEVHKLMKYFPFISELLLTMLFGDLSDTELIIWTKDFKKPNKNYTEVCMAEKKLPKGGNFVLPMEMAIQEIQSERFL